MVLISLETSSDVPAVFTCDTSSWALLLTRTRNPAFAAVLHPQTLHAPSSLSLDRFVVTTWNLGTWAFSSISFQGFPTCTLRKWNPRPACGTAVKSVRISMSVFGFVPTRDEPAECLPWTRRTGVRRYLPCLEMYVSAADSRWPRPYVR